MAERLEIKVHRARKKAGRKGGLTTLRRRGRRLFRKASLSRRRFGGGRPKKNSRPVLTRT